VLRVCPQTTNLLDEACFSSAHLVCADNEQRDTWVTSAAVSDYTGQASMLYVRVPQL
jgi:hypothetical protein